MLKRNKMIKNINPLYLEQYRLHPGDRHGQREQRRRDGGQGWFSGVIGGGGGGGGGGEGVC